MSDEEQEGGRGAEPSAEDPVEGGALEQEQQGKGYGEDPGEREESLPGE